jgi:hypothetical protein
VHGQLIVLKYTLLIKKKGFLSKEISKTYTFITRWIELINARTRMMDIKRHVVEESKDTCLETILGRVISHQEEE